MATALLRYGALSGRAEVCVLFDVQVSSRDGWVVVAPVGELDLANAPAVRAAVGRAVAQAPAPPAIVVDLSDVHLIDSSGMGVLLGALRRVRSATPPGVLVVVAGPAVARTLAAVELERVLDVRPAFPEPIGSGSASRG